MTERAVVSKGQRRVQGSELAAFLAVQSSGREITERQSIITRYFTSACPCVT